MNEQKLLFIDVETTGKEEIDRLCEVAYKVCRAENRDDFLFVEERFKPAVDISIEAMSITHITNEMVADKPKFKTSETFTKLKELYDEDAIFIAHNAAFDLKFLEKEGLPMPQRWICTMKMSHHHDKKAEYTMNNLQYLRYLYGLSFDQEIIPHQAMSDILVLEKVFNYFAEHYTLDEMVEISSVPILMKKMPFGKHKGKLMSDIAKVDMNYFKWVHNNVDMDENLKHTIEHYLPRI